MRVVVFCHSIISDWNHGNAHFLRGIGTELIRRGHQVSYWEPQDAWSLVNLVHDHGPNVVDDFKRVFPQLEAFGYSLAQLDLDAVLEAVDLVLVHEWNEPELIARIGRHRARCGRYRLLFHDTHHRMATAPAEMRQFDLKHYDGVLAFGQVIADLYRTHTAVQHTWAWHEAADTRVFYPRTCDGPRGDCVWVGNWGDEERSRELGEFLIEPVRKLGLNAQVYGVRYPEVAKGLLAQAHINYRGWLANYRVPEVFGRHLFTLHVPRRPYAHLLPGIPTIRVFEALACGIPLVCAPWSDEEGLFTPGRDYLVARNGREMGRLMTDLLADPALRAELIRHGRETILNRHTCSHRVDELLALCGRFLGLEATNTREAVATT